MNSSTYAIAPTLERIDLDPELSQAYPTLAKSLQWRPLTADLESCEQHPYLYFRLSLVLRSDDSIYAGFPSGAPFILSRDAEPHKRKFFLRHWIRVHPIDPTAQLPLADSPLLRVGAHANTLLIRVEVDRQFDVAHVFRSVPFATVMFQVVQLDAIIHQLPHVRLALSIERTVTNKERELIPDSVPTVSSSALPAISSAASSADSSRPSANPPQTTTVPLEPSSVPQPPTLPQTQPQAQPTVVSAAPPPSTRAQLPPRAPSNMVYHAPYQYAASRYVAMQMRQSGMARPATIGAQPARPGARAYARHTGVATPIAAAPASNSTGMANGSASGHAGNPGHTAVVTEYTKSSSHPEVRLWDEHDVNDPYEPIFVTEDDKFFAEKARRTIVLDVDQGLERQYDYDSLFGQSISENQPANVMAPVTPDVGNEADIEVVVSKRDHTRERAPIDVDERDKPDTRRDDSKRYHDIVQAAVAYNKGLRDERSGLQKWLLEDAERREQQEDADEEEDDDSMSE